MFNFDLIKLYRYFTIINFHKLLKFKNINLSFENQKVIDNLSFDIEKGKVAIISGVSGRGKTSILNLIQGYLVADKGEIEINGIQLSDKTIDEIRKLIAFIPQNINLPVNSGLELIQMMEITANVNSINQYLNELGLENEILSKKFTEISGGQKQRIIIAICLSLDKEIILMDEPTASLDEKSIELLISTIKNLKNKTIISASHNQTWIKNADIVIEL